MNPLLSPTDHDLALVAAATLELTTVASELIEDGVNSLGSPGSRAEANVFDQRNISTGGEAKLVQDAHLVMFVTSASAVDHVRLYVEGASRRLATVALASVVRAALENMSRASYLLRAESIDELVTRLVGLSRHEVIHPARVGATFQDSTGSIVDPREYPERLAAALAKLKLTAPAVPSAENLVKMLLRPMLKTDDAEEALRVIYSQLSGVAHGNVTGLGMYRQADGSFAYPLRMATEHAGYLYSSACSVGDIAIDYFGSERAARARWNAARDRATAAVVELAERRDD